MRRRWGNRAWAKVSMDRCDGGGRSTGVLARTPTLLLRKGSVGRGAGLALFAPGRLREGIFAGAPSLALGGGLGGLPSLGLLLFLGLPLGAIGTVIRGERNAGGVNGYQRTTFGGRPLGLRGASVEGPAVVAAASAARVFLFLLPGGRPRLRLGGGSVWGAKIARSRD